MRDDRKIPETDQEKIDSVPVKYLIDRLRKTQVWKRDLVDKRVKEDFTIALWLEETGIGPGAHRIRASVLYANYKEFCVSKKLNENSIYTLQNWGRFIRKERLLPKNTATDRNVYYHLNKDITPDAEREKRKVKNEIQKKRKQKSVLKKANEAAKREQEEAAAAQQALGTPTPDVQ